MFDVVSPIVRPVMRAWFRHSARASSNVPVPTDAPTAHAPGVDTDRILVFGTSATIASGVLSFDLGLPGQLARELSRHTGRGVDVDVHATPALTVETAVAAAVGLSLWRYDAIVVVLGGGDALMYTTVAVWRRELATLLEVLRLESSSATSLVVAGIPPLAGVAGLGGVVGLLGDRQALRLNASSVGTCQAGGATFVALSAQDPGSHRYRTADDYLAWAGVLAAPLARDMARADPLLDKAAGEGGARDGGRDNGPDGVRDNRPDGVRDNRPDDGSDNRPDDGSDNGPDKRAHDLVDMTTMSRLAPETAPDTTPETARVRREGPQQEDERQAALDALRILDTTPETSLDDIVGAARAAFGTRFAAFTLIDRDRQWIKSRVGFDDAEGHRVDDLCVLTVQQGSVLVIADVASDPRFGPRPGDRQDLGVGFFAGQAVESPSGHRIGVLCVFDPAAREVGSLEPAQLAGFAHAIAGAVWRRGKSG